MTEEQEYTANMSAALSMVDRLAQQKSGQQQNIRHFFDRSLEESRGVWQEGTVGELVTFNAAATGGTEVVGVYTDFMESRDDRHVGYEADAEERQMDFQRDMTEQEQFHGYRTHVLEETGQVLVPEGYTLEGGPAEGGDEPTEGPDYRPEGSEEQAPSEGNGEEQ